MPRFPGPRPARRLAAVALWVSLPGLPALAAQSIGTSQGPPVTQHPGPSPRAELGDERRASVPPASPEPEGGGTAVGFATAQAEPWPGSDGTEPLDTDTEDPPQGGKGGDLPPHPKWPKPGPLPGFQLAGWEPLDTDTEDPPQGGKGGDLPPIPKPPKPKQGFAVELSAGEVELREADLALAGIGLDFAWVRTYRSRAPFELDTPQGVQWDHSYNVYLEPAGGDLILHPGNGRADRFRAGPGGNYTHRDYFVVGRENQDGSLTFTWPHGGRWNFHALGGGPVQGRLETIVDRNGNTIELHYDGAGRLGSITDTLNRSIAVSYDLNDRVSAVTGPDGRTWTYSYHTDASPNGAQGDLKSVTTPALTTTTGTCSLAPRPLSPGNTFPMGKTRTFTYSKGLADTRLNHNLLTATHPSGDTWIANTYSSTTDEDAVDFDRLIAQEPAGSGDRWSYHYVDRSTSPFSPRLEVIVNDRRGVVTHYLHGAGGDLLEQRVFTGYANPALPTTLVTNRPMPPGNPPFYLTRYEHNGAGQLTRVVHPEGNEELYVHEGELNGNAGPRRAGNLREKRAWPGPQGGSQAEIVELWEYDALTNFVAKHVDPDLGETLHSHDAAGNRLQTVLADPALVHEWTYDSRGRRLSHTWPDDGAGYRRVDECTYGASGHLETLVRDSGPGGLDLTRTFGWSAAGRLVCLTDERGNSWDFERNKLDQVVRRTGPVLSSLGGARFELDLTYDANGNLTQLDVQNRDETGALEANTHLTTTLDFDTGYNDPVRLTREVDIGVTGSTEFEYDASRNLALIRYDGAVSGVQPHQVVGLVYDERDQVYQVRRSQGGPDQSTEQLEYDGNGLLVTRTSGLEAVARTTAYEYDGYDRLIRVTDAMGNRRSYDYDARSNRVSRAIEGELLDTLGSAGNVLLSSTLYEYDALSRLTRVVDGWFDPGPPAAPIGAGVSEWVYAWSGTTLASMTDPALAVTAYGYDGAMRLERITDAEGNTVDLVRDGCGDVLARTETHLSTTNPPSAWVWSCTYDELGRLTRRDGPAGPPLTFAYDSRGNLRRAVDERGNVTRYAYDGLDRLVARERDLTDTGTGSGAVVSTQTTSYGYDYQFGLTTVTDDDGHATIHGYDDLGRCVSVQYPDLTLHTRSFDAHDDVITQTRASGTLISSTHDGLGRLTARSLVPGPGVSSDTTLLAYAYDGLGRLVAASDDDSSVARAYDSLGNLREDEITIAALGGPVTLTTDLQHDARGLPTTVVYPGGRALVYEWDGLARDTRISEGGGDLCIDEWVGPRRRLERTLYPGALALHAYDARLRPSSVQVTYGASTRVERSATWTPAGGLASLHDDLQAGSDFDFTLDSLGRLVESVETLPSATTQTVTYALSDVGDRTLVTGGPMAGGYTTETQVHQYTQVPGTPAAHDLGYDDNGNLLSRDPLGPPAPGLFAYDGMDRLVQHTAGATGKVTRFAYDALGRRVSKVRDAAGTPESTLYGYCGELVIEETDGSGSTQATFVWRLDGRAGAEATEGLAGGELTGAQTTAQLVSMRRAGVDTRLHQDPLGNVAAAVDLLSGLLVERYEYEDHGAPRVFDPFGMQLVGSAIGNPFSYRCLRYDVETRSFLGMPGCSFDPLLGRTLSRQGNLGAGSGGPYFLGIPIQDSLERLSAPYPVLGSAPEAGGGF